MVTFQKYWCLKHLQSQTVCLFYMKEENRDLDFYFYFPAKIDYHFEWFENDKNQRLHILLISFVPLLSWNSDVHLEKKVKNITSKVLKLKVWCAMELFLLNVVIPYVLLRIWNSCMQQKTKINNALKKNSSISFFHVKDCLVGRQRTFRDPDFLFLLYHPSGRLPFKRSIHGSKKRKERQKAYMQRWLCRNPT